MKKLAILLLVFLLTGCLNSEVSDVFVLPSNKEGGGDSYLYTPGTYTGQAMGYNGLIVVSVTVDDTKITDINIIDNPEKNYTLIKETIIDSGDIDPTLEEEGEEETGETGQTIKTAIDIEVIGTMDAVCGEVIMNQSIDIETDICTNATVSASALLEAIKDALNQATL